MPLKECANKHLFNGDTHGDICPVCGLYVSGVDRRGMPKTEDQIIAELTLPPEKWVCGWLLCIEGVNKGRDYRIYPGRNYIGSGDGMDIQILGERSVDKYRHAAIVYEPQEKETSLLPGQSRSLVYLKQKPVYARQKLTANDIIELGQTKLLFKECCGENFNWEEQT
ncbi:MAG: FHA domain-containing protein [Firmicutes bacterium]|nr:FHA domain-containing protein [Bacillota bacterium]